MKILWIINNLLPEATKLLTGKGESRETGGWILGASESLLNSNSHLNLYVASISPLVKDFTTLYGERIIHYVIPYGKGNIKYNPEYEKYWSHINDIVNPDIVHIHGTEYAHGLAYLNACSTKNVVISLQGIKSGIAPYYTANISRFSAYMNTTIRDIIKGNMFKEQKNFYCSGEIEKEMLRKVNHIIGRTSWDRAHAWVINPKALYHFCNETLRSEFYDGSKWNYGQCEKHTIFLSQAGYPVKGLHQVLRAMPLILQHYPTAKIKIAGIDITRYTSLRDKIRISGYGKLIHSMIRNLHLKEHIEFLGSLNAEQMKQAYLNCNVFVCPSSIENSPNSLGEAQILGVPHVASYVGGVPDMMVGNEENLYRFNEITMLAEKICRIFANEGNQIDMSSVALQRHHKVCNTEQLLEIYNQINK